VRNATDLQITAVNGIVRIVAIGSSSTAGNGASTPANGYVSVIQTSLIAKPQAVDFVVVNAGVAGNSLADVQARLQRDALSLNPQLVILQVGVNDALSQPNQEGVTAFENRLRDTIAQIKTVSPILLVTGQYFQGQPSYYESYMASMYQIAQQQRLPVFDRYYIMKNAIISGNYSFADLSAADRFHPNDTMHRCIGQVIANLITNSVHS
jgi:lysophospholipase L1-like esterase